MHQTERASPPTLQPPRFLFCRLPRRLIPIAQAVGPARISARLPLPDRKASLEVAGPSTRGERVLEALPINSAFSIRMSAGIRRSVLKWSPRPRQEHQLRPD